MLKSAVKHVLDQILRIPACRRHVENSLRNLPTTNPMVTFAPPGHFYSPLPDLDALTADQERIYREATLETGLQLDLDRQVHLLTELAAYHSDFAWPLNATAGHRYYLQNGFFGHGDASILHAMMRHFQPTRIVEVGSGFSSALMLDTNEQQLGGKLDLCFIEPFPDRLNQLLSNDDRSRVRVLCSPVQAVAGSTFESLDRNDILFIDSSHVAKAGSDVNHLFFSIIPRLRKGVLIHIHDVFYPFEYPFEWFRDGRAWNELYLVRAFLQYNSAFEILMFNSYVCAKAQGAVSKYFPGLAKCGGGSLWLRKANG